MGINNTSTGINAAANQKTAVKSSEDDRIIAFAGNPNVGKSTLFNALTGLNQHTGNWAGKTVTNAWGTYLYKDKRFLLVDLPGTYSLLSSSPEEEIARDFICFGKADALVIVTDATCLERNLNLVLQCLEITKNAVVCVNLLDEAKKKKIDINLGELSRELGVPVVGTSARSKKGLDTLVNVVFEKSSVSEAQEPLYIDYGQDLNSALTILENSLLPYVKAFSGTRWIALKLLDSDKAFLSSLNEYSGFDILNEEEVYIALDKAKTILSEKGINKEKIKDIIVSSLVKKAEELHKKCVCLSSGYSDKDRRLDNILTSKKTGIPVMLLLLGIVFFITIIGANYPSEILSYLFNRLEKILLNVFAAMNVPAFFTGLFIKGMYRTLAWVVSVMLPPMAIFFPFFTLLEDSGYLPRIAFNMDRYFKWAGAHGKQALTMCMGLGCNACGVTGCRIIDSKRERLIAILTNTFVPCNGRFPTLISIITMFFIGGSAGLFNSLGSAALLLIIIMSGVFATLIISKLLSKTLLKGLPSSFALELPPFRRPQIGKVIVRSILDRTVFVLGRAVMTAAPAGIIIWLLANVQTGDMSLLAQCAGFLDPFAKIIGLDGYILIAFILGFPANEIVMPIIIMGYMSKGEMLELSSLAQLKELLVNNGWTWVTALCTMLFSLFHFPCATTCLTIKKETKSNRWTAAAFLIPTGVGIIVCFITAVIGKIFVL